MVCRVTRRVELVAGGSAGVTDLEDDQSRDDSGDMKKVLPIKRWLTGDQDLLRLANKLFGARRPNRQVDLSAIK